MEILKNCIFQQLDDELSALQMNGLALQFVAVRFHEAVIINISVIGQYQLISVSL